MHLEILFVVFVFAVLGVVCYYDIVEWFADRDRVAQCDEAVLFAVHAFFGRRNRDEACTHIATAIRHGDAAVKGLTWLPFVSGRTMVLNRLNAMPGTERLVREHIGREVIAWADQARADATEEER